MTLSPGYDYRTTPPGLLDRACCPVCGDVMRVERNRTGPTGWAGAVARKAQPHDAWVCPQAEAGWHQRAKAIRQEADRTTSTQLRTLLLNEAGEIIRLTRT